MNEPASKLGDLGQYVADQLSDPQQIVRDSITRTVIDVLRVHQEKVNVGLQDSVSDLLESFRDNVVADIVSVYSGWTIPDQSYDLLPKGVRFCRERGKKRVYVVEQEPQLRTIRIIDNVEQDSMTSGPKNFLLAFPFVIFVATVDEGKVTKLHTGWSRTTLTSIDNALTRPALPNIHKSLQVCVGDSHMFDGTRTSDTQAVDEAIQGFWSSSFNRDLSEGWDSKPMIDERLRTGVVWSDHSKANPRFVLEFNFASSGFTVRNVVSRVIEGESGSATQEQMRQRLSETADACAQELFHGILRYHKRKKFDAFYPKDVTNHLSEHVASCVRELVGVVYGMRKELAALQSENEQIIWPMTKHWRPYDGAV